jgi:hypothetical protein
VSAAAEMIVAEETDPPGCAQTRQKDPGIERSVGGDTDTGEKTFLRRLNFQSQASDFNLKVAYLSCINPFYHETFLGFSLHGRYGHAGLGA